MEVRQLSRDDRHITMKKPPNAGSYYYNYKGFHGIVLMAVADDVYKLMCVDVGAEGGASNGGTWSNCSLHDAVEDDRAGVPQPEPLLNDDKPVPYYLVGDDAFELRTWMMKPFSHRSEVQRERVYSCRLSRARRVVEFAFGIVSQVPLLIDNNAAAPRHQPDHHVCLCPTQPHPQ